MPTVILLDLSYFIFYRYYALHAWWKLAKPDDDLGVPIENKDFKEKFIKTFKEKIKEISKKLKVKDFEIIAARDCSRENIWRNKIYNDYKANRVYDDDFMGGPFFKLGIEIIQELKINIIYMDNLEADDCIALYSKFVSDTKNIIIIANDMDYLQLNCDNINIYNLKYKNLADNKKWSGDKNFDLFTKIIIGDKSDNIPCLFKKCGPKKIQELYNNTEIFNNLLKSENAEDSYLRNKKLVDFNEIPEDLVDKFYAKYFI